MHVGTGEKLFGCEGQFVLPRSRGEKLFEDRIWGTFSFLVKTKIEVYKQYTGMSIHHHI